MPLITCRDVCMQYENKAVVDHVDFEVQEGDYICIVGENGSGKSTLLKGILGLMHPSAGKIIFGDGLHQNEIGYLPQQTQIQRDFPASVWEVVLSGCLGRIGFHPFYAAQDKRRAEQNLERMGIADICRRSFRDLSGGQRQRVLLARALCATRKLLLLDEPVTGLDPIATTELYALIARLNRQEGVAVVTVSHDVSGALRDARQILHLGTQMVFFGTTDAYLCSEAGKRWMGGSLS